MLSVRSKINKVWSVMTGPLFMSDWFEARLTTGVEEIYFYKSKGCLLLSEETMVSHVYWPMF